MHELTFDEIDLINGGMNAVEAAKMSAFLGGVASLYGAGAAIPSPLSPVLGIIGGVTGAAAAGYGLYALYLSK